MDNAMEFLPAGDDGPTGVLSLVGRSFSRFQDNASVKLIFDITRGKSLEYTKANVCLRVGNKAESSAD